MNWISAHPELAGVAIVITLLTVGASKIVPGAKTHKGLMWLAFAVYAICGLILGWALAGVVSWLTAGRSGAAGLFSSIAAIAAVFAGWHAVSMIVALLRDVADKRPDEDARRAALWVPVLLPAGWQAVIGTVTNTNGAVTGIVAGIQAAITIVYAHKIVAEALKGKSGRKAWNWFAAAVCLLAGLITLPLALYFDGVLSGWVDGGGMQLIRLVVGIVGVALLIAAASDLKDKIPDQHVRRFLSYGLPLLLAFGSASIAAAAGFAANGGALLGGLQ